MKIGILGSGNMGRSLGMRWAELGHQVFFGGRDAEKARSIALFVGHGSQGGTLEEAARFGEVLVHTARGALPSALVPDLSVFDGKVLIDLNNGPIPNGFAYEPVALSFAERFQTDVPGLKVVKAFNTMAQEVFEHEPQTLRQHAVSVFVAGDDADAKASVMQLADEIGFVAVDAGGLRNARLLESVGDLIRYMIGGAPLGPQATISVHVLPEPTSKRLGGRQPSKLR